MLVVSRLGQLDTVDVQWSVGPLLGGALTPPTGSLTMLPSQTTALISLTVRYTANICLYTTFGHDVTCFVGNAHHSPWPRGGVCRHTIYTVALHWSPRESKHRF